MTSGVYIITNTVTSEQYVGVSEQVEVRARQHWMALARGYHSNPRLQAAWDEYGSAAFSFKLVEPVALTGKCWRDKDLLREAETRMIEQMKPAYNAKRVPLIVAEVGTDLWATQLVQYAREVPKAG